jgi:predicted esterase
VEIPPLKTICIFVAFLALTGVALGQRLIPSELDPQLSEAREKAFIPWSNPEESSTYWLILSSLNVPIYNERKPGNFSRDIYIPNPGISYCALGGLSAAELWRVESDKIKIGDELVSASVYQEEKGTPVYWALWAPKNKASLLEDKMHELGISPARVEDFPGETSTMPTNPPAEGPPSKEQMEQLIQQQPVLANPAVFSGDTFPKVEFQNKDLVKAALGSYSLTVRYFDADWNEVQKPALPGRYGAWVDIRFANGTTDTRHLTLFKTAAPYNPKNEPSQIELQFPAAFGISKEVAEREQWNAQEFLNRVLTGGDQRDSGYAGLLAAIHDCQADPGRWHGFSFWRIDDEWWSTLEKKLGLSQDYQRLVHVPDDYDKDPAKKWPLILFLHGSGERGDNLDKLRNQGPLGYINQGHSLPFVVVSPQCPKGQSWNPERLSHLIDEIEASYRIDPKRVYITGLSMGGYGTFDLAGFYPQRFAAIASLSGGENPEIAERIKGVPTWIFHGADDPVVPVRYSTDMAEQMKRLDAEVRLTVYPGVGHGGWGTTYANPELYAWFLRHALK